MAVETERKFLVFSKAPVKGLTGQKLTQGYLHEKGMTTRVRVIDDTQALITLKGSRNGLGRPEYEYPIPLEDARELLSMCEGRILTKTRYEVLVGSHVWHFDVYGGRLKGLLTAEVELQDENEAFEVPRWAGPEVTYDKSYTNKRLAICQRVPLRLAA